MVPLHVELRESRERKGVTLEAVQAATRINPEFLNALERGDFDFLPKTYIRLFLRTYATQVGMDPQYVLDRYEEIKRPPVEEVQASPAVERQRPLSWGGVMALAVGLTLLGFAGVTLFKGKMRGIYPTASRGISPSPSVSVEETAGEGTPDSVRVSVTDRASKAATTATATDTAADTMATGTTDKGTFSARVIPTGIVWTGKDSVMVLRGVGVEQTWLEISADGERVFYGTMRPGDERTWMARGRFYIVAGRSSGVQLSLQGKPLPRAKTWASEVLRMSITRNGVTVEQKPREERSRLAAAPEDTVSSRRSSAADTVSSGQ